MLKKMLPSFIALLALGTVTTATASSHAGPYLNFNIGYAHQVGKNSFTVSSIQLNTRSSHNFAWNALGGYNWDWTDHSGVALELGYADYGSMEWDNTSTGDSVDIDQTAYLLQLVYNYYWKKDFTAFAKGGLAFGRTNLNTDGAIGTNSSSLTTNLNMTNQKYHNTLPMVTFGGTWTFMPQVAVNLMWEHIFGGKLKVDNTDQFQTVDSFMIGFKYTFDM